MLRVEGDGDETRRGQRQAGAVRLPARGGTLFFSCSDGRGPRGGMSTLPVSAVSQDFLHFRFQTRRAFHPKAIQKFRPKLRIFYRKK